MADRMENAGDLIDTAELRAALSQRKAARDGLLSQTGGLGDEKSGRGRRRRPLDTEGAGLKYESASPQPFSAAMPPTPQLHSSACIALPGLLQARIFCRWPDRRLRLAVSLSSCAMWATSILVPC